MKPQRISFFMILCGLCLVFQSCTRSSNDVWEDTKSAGRHFQRSCKALTGDHAESRQIRSRQEFECIEDGYDFPQGQFQEYDYQNQNGINEQNFYQDFSVNANEDFIPLDDPTNELAMGNGYIAPARETPGERGSAIPGIQAFRDPSQIPQLAAIFRPVYFEYNCNLVKGPQNYQTLHAIASFLQYHPNVYVFIEGHTDERGPQAYNLALGSRRANEVRNLLINEGVNPDRLFTLSYGKERPVVLDRHEEAFGKNRRAEFKIYER